MGVVRRHPLTPGLSGRIKHLRFLNCEESDLHVGRRKSTDFAGHAIPFTALAEGGVEMWQAWEFISCVYGCGWHLLAVKMGEGVKCKR